MRLEYESTSRAAARDGQEHVKDGVGSQDDVSLPVLDEVDGASEADVRWERRGRHLYEMIADARSVQVQECVWIYMYRERRKCVWGEG